ncbi:hypothetical protein BHE74_00055814 [Ensete ventricosum]|nr:hypothetical protein BHE74_00055814 [Ensete ventricosum]
MGFTKGYYELNLGHLPNIDDFTSCPWNRYGLVQSRLYMGIHVGARGEMRTESEVRVNVGREIPDSIPLKPKLVSRSCRAYKV